MGKSGYPLYNTLVENTIMAYMSPNDHMLFMHIAQAWVTGTGTTVLLHNSQWSNPDGYDSNWTISHQQEGLLTVCSFHSIYYMNVLHKYKIVQVKTHQSIITIFDIFPRRLLYQVFYIVLFDLYTIFV